MTALPARKSIHPTPDGNAGSETKEPSSERVLRALRAAREPTPPAGMPSLVASRPVPTSGLRTRDLVPATLPPVFLATADYHGTLAAVRSLGRAGIRVTTAASGRLAVAAWSKYATHRVRCPPVLETERFLEWLKEFGRTHEKHVLLPTCDDTAWLYAQHRAELSKYFFVMAPEISAVHGLLNKRLLHDNALKVGLATPRTWFPQGLDDLVRVKNEAHFPLVLKPVTQVLYATRQKGVRVDRPEDLEEAYKRFSVQRHETSLLDFDASLSLPMAQEFHPEAATSIYNLSSFARAGRLLGVRASRKLLQRPRKIGVGVCFEEAPVFPHLVAGIERLVASVGFNGVFEAEFIAHGGDLMLIDFNPRFYNQMAFDIARGLPLPLLCYYYALGDQEKVSRLCQSNEQDSGLSGRVYAYRAGLQVLLKAQRLSGALHADEARTWNEWYEAHRGHCVDPVEDADDPWPARVDLAQLVRHSLRHPRSFVRSIVLDRST